MRRSLRPEHRKLLLLRDVRCRYCGVVVVGDDFHVDHVVPVVQEGSNMPWNLVCACIGCNLSKSGKTPTQWGTPLRPIALWRHVMYWIGWAVLRFGLGIRTFYAVKEGDDEKSDK